MAKIDGVLFWTLFSERIAPGIFKINPRMLRSEYPGGRLNKKDGLTRYGNSHVKDKTS